MSGTQTIEEVCAAMGGQILSENLSSVDNTTFNYRHDVVDYGPAGGGGSGCSSCGAASAGGGRLPNFALQRIHSHRDQTWWSSFGPGIYSNFDTKIAFYNSGNVLDVFDPRDQQRRRLYDGTSGDPTRDGVFTDTISRSFKDVRLLTAAGQLTTSLATAKKAILNSWDGSRHEFDVINTGPSQPIPIEGKAGGALYFDGNDFIDLANPQNLQITGQITLSAWVRTDATGGVRNIVAHGQADSPKGEVSLRLNNAAYEVGSWNGTTFKVAASMPTGGADLRKWVHLTGLYDGASWRLYRNGVQIGAAATTAGAVAVNGDWAIGARGTGTERFFQGGIDDVRVYNRGLTAEEVTQLANGAPPADGLVSHWTLDNNAAQDSAGQNHGVLGGTNDICGRLAKIVNRNEQSVTVTYKTFTAEELAEAPDRQWQIDTVTDARGHVGTFSYHPQQQSGRWVVSQVALPNETQVSYQYADGRLSQVTLPDGAVSTFEYGVNANSGTSTITFDDAAADGTHRRKTAYLTNNISLINSDANAASLVNSASLMARMVVNGAGEVAYLNIDNPNHGSGNEAVIYEGAGKLKAVHGGWSAQYYKDGWTLGDPKLGYAAIAGSRESRFANTWGVGGAGDPHLQYRTGTLSRMRDEAGRNYDYQYDANGNQTKKTYVADGSYEAWTYDEANQVVRQRDRLGRVTRFTYDARGNQLTREVGILDVDGQDVNQPEFAVYTKEYYPEGHANQFLLKAEIDPSGDRTDYQYNSQGYVTKIIEPSDEPGGPRPEKTFTYDDAGRMLTSVDPLGRTATYAYDARNRVTKITYGDGSSERSIYGTGDQSHLLVASVDRMGVATKYEYDAMGRRVKTIQAAATIDANGVETPIADPAVRSETTVVYFPGTELVREQIAAGDRTSYDYDYRHRLIGTTAYPRAGQSLTTRQTYIDNLLFSTTDPYGRKKFFAYRASDNALIREIQATIPSYNLADFPAVTKVVRPAEPETNGKFLVTDYVVLDPEQQRLDIVDPRGFHETNTYDSRGRLIENVKAAGTDVAAKTQTVYDAEGRVIETRSPRFFDPNDANGFGKSRTVTSYTGRGLVKTTTEAPDTDVAATTTFAYDLAGQQIARIDPRGNTWTTLWSDCCANRQTGTLNPLGEGTSTDYDFAGRTIRSRTLKGAEVFHETTTRYDARGRVTHQCVWLVDAPALNAGAPAPIAGEDGVPADSGLTTRYVYDDNLADGVGLDALAPAALAGLNFVSGSDGAATLVIDPSGRRSISVKDGMGRSVRSAQLAVATADVLTSNTTIYDAMVTITGFLTGTTSGLVLETARANALGHTTRSRTDGAGRTIQTVDAENFVTSLTYDASGNQVKTRDPNSVGQDCVYDALNRDVQCADTLEITLGVNRKKEYDLAGNVVKEIDAKTNFSTHAYDARGRKIATTDRLGGITRWAYDTNGNQLSLTDAENQTTSYAYDAANRKLTETYPDHVAGTSPPDLGYGIVAFTHDGAGRMKTKTDQQGDFVTYVYDRAHRLLAREYRERIKQPSDAPNDTDSFTYDAAGNMLTAVSGRYSNTVTLTYDDARRKATESLTIYGQTYTVGTQYDAASRLTRYVYPDGSLVDRVYTPRGRLSQVKLDGSVVDTRTYDDGGRMTKSLYANGVSDNRTYNTDNTLKKIAHLGAPIGDYSYTWDVNKNKTAETITGVLAPYSFTTGATGYDSDNRLNAWNRSNGDSQSWNLSLVGDWNSSTINGTTQTRTHGPAHEFLSSGGQNVQHDAKGNTTFLPANLRPNNRNLSLTWDFDNRISNADTDGDSVLDLSFKYNSEAGLVNKGNAVYIQADYQIVAEYTAGAAPLSPTEKYVYGSYIDEPLIKVGTGGTIYYHRSHQYSIVALSNALKGVVERNAYTGYGFAHFFDGSGSSISDSQLKNNFTFTGQMIIDDIRQYSFRARMYDQAMGRFLSRDPARYISGNSMYSFMGNRPLGKLDPTGLAEFTVDADSFIPWPWVSIPPVFSNGVWSEVKGNDRDFTSLPTRSSTKSKSFNWIVVDSCSCNHLMRDNARKEFGSGMDSSTRRDWSLIWGWMYYTGTGSYYSTESANARCADLFVHPSSCHTSVFLQMSASSPFSITWLPAAINHTYTVDLYHSGDYVNWFVSGRHDGFPAHEFWLRQNGEVLSHHRYSPGGAHWVGSAVRLMGFYASQTYYDSGSVRVSDVCCCK